MDILQLEVFSSFFKRSECIISRDIYNLNYIFHSFNQYLLKTYWMNNLVLSSKYYILPDDTYQLLKKMYLTWIFLSTLLVWLIDTEADTPITWPPDAKSWLIVKDPDAGKDWKQKETGVAEDKMVR